MIYLGTDKWDGPTTLHEMLNTKNERILRRIPNYFINLFSLADFRDEDFEKINTDLGFAMNAIRRTNVDLVDLLQQNKGREIDRQSAVFINEFADPHLEYTVSDEGGKIDMCKSMQEHDKKQRYSRPLMLIESSSRMTRRSSSWWSNNWSFRLNMSSA